MTTMMMQPSEARSLDDYIAEHLGRKNPEIHFFKTDETELVLRGGRHRDPLSYFSNGLMLNDSTPNVQMLHELSDSFAVSAVLQGELVMTDAKRGIRLEFDPFSGWRLKRGEKAQIRCVYRVISTSFALVLYEMTATSSSFDPEDPEAMDKAAASAHRKMREKIVNVHFDADLK